MSFISQETLKKMRQKRGIELDLAPYVGAPLKVLVRPIPFSEATPLAGINDTPTGEQVQVLIRSLGAAVLDPATMEPIGEQELRALFDELGVEEGTKLLGELQDLAFKSRSPGN